MEEIDAISRLWAGTKRTRCEWSTEIDGLIAAARHVRGVQFQHNAKFQRTAKGRFRL